MSDDAQKPKYKSVKWSEMEREWQGPPSIEQRLMDAVQLCHKLDRAREAERLAARKYIDAIDVDDADQEHAYHEYVTARNKVNELEKSDGR